MQLTIPLPKPPSISAKFIYSGAVPISLVTSETPVTIPSVSIASIGPTEQRATKPKLSSWACLPPRTVAKPRPNAIMNGTVMGPVVTPPESNATGTILGFDTATVPAIANMSTYIARRTFVSSTFFITLTNASTSETPTPAATVRITTHLLIELN